MVGEMGTTDRARSKWGHRDGPAQRQPVPHGRDLVVLEPLRGVNVALGSPLHIGNTDRFAVAEHVRGVEDLDRPASERTRRRASPSLAWPGWSTPAGPG